MQVGDTVQDADGNTGVVQSVDYLDLGDGDPLPVGTVVWDTDTAVDVTPE